MMKHKLCTSKQINLILDKNLSVRLFLVVKNYTYRSMNFELNFTPGLKFMIIRTEH